MLNQPLVHRDCPLVFTLSTFSYLFAGVCDVFLVCFGEVSGRSPLTKTIGLGTLSLVDYGMVMRGMRGVRVNGDGVEEGEGEQLIPIVETMNTLSSLSRTDIMKLLPGNRTGKGKAEGELRMICSWIRSDPGCVAWT